MKIDQIIETLDQTPGLFSCKVLDTQDKEIVRELEESRNLGVFACLDRSVTLLVLHDASFRDPITPIVQTVKDELCFPPIDFPEVKAKHVVSSSPCGRVHRFLMERFHMHANRSDASLLIGFDV